MTTTIKLSRRTLLRGAGATGLTLGAGPITGFRTSSPPSP